MTYLLTICFLVFVTKAADVYSQSDAEMFKVLLEKIEQLAMSDAANKREIVALKSEMNDMKIVFLKKEANFLAEINDLKSNLHINVLSQDENEAKILSSKIPTRDIKTDHTGPEKIAEKFLQDGVNKRKRSLALREVVETEVAFYATHSHHDIQHLGQNQIIVFDRDVTNIGNAYNPNHGGFVAPVDGTYVFHVTMMGKDAHAVSSNHFSAHIDVDGAVYSQLWVEPYKQSSQMFVVELGAGKTVSVKNHFLDDGFIGQHMSTFSGFLLYEHPDSSVIVGK